MPWSSPDKMVERCSRREHHSQQLGEDIRVKVKSGVLVYTIRQFCGIWTESYTSTHYEIQNTLESFYVSPPNFSLSKSPVLKPAPGRIS